MLDVTATIGVDRKTEFVIGNVKIVTNDDEAVQLRFTIEEDALAKALSPTEVRALIEAISAEHGVDVFEGVAQSVIDEFIEERAEGGAQ